MKVSPFDHRQDRELGDALRSALTGSDEAAFVQLDVSPVLPADLIQAGTDLCEAQFQAFAVQPRQDLPGGNGLAFLHENLDDFARDALPAGAATLGVSPELHRLTPRTPAVPPVPSPILPLPWPAPRRSCWRNSIRRPL